MTTPISQANRPLLATPPGSAPLVPVSLVAEEAVSEPFLFTVDFTSPSGSIAAADVLGKPLPLGIPLTDGTTRPVHGIVRRFTNLGRTGPTGQWRYRAEIVPKLWLLTLSSDCRTFEEMTVFAIVEAVCKAAGVTDIRSDVAGNLPTLPYVVQYNETDFAFVSRLLEEAGLYYTFEQEETKHVLVVSDKHAGTIPAGLVPSLRIVAQSRDGQMEPDSVGGFVREFAVHAAGVSLADHALLRADSVGEAPSRNVGAAGTRFSFLGDLGPNASADVAKRRIEAEEVGRDVVRGTSNCAALQAGTRVKLTHGPLGSSGAEFHLLRVTHELTIGDVGASSGLGWQYQNTFTAVPVQTRYRPPRVTARPSVRGTQTAKVVGSGGDGQIDVDADGCVLLQFPWDRGAGKDGKSQHRVHVASVWAGTQWGFVQLPRIGQEVLVEFLEGDPDRPIVTGRVYNSANKPPYALTANKTQSGWKSRSVGGGADNFNELRFEDKQGEEHVYLQAEKDLQIKVKNDETRDVLNDRTTTIERDCTTTIKRDRKTTINQDATTGIDRDRTTTVSRHDKLEVTSGNLTIGVKSGNISVKADAGSITIEAMQGITLKCGPSTIKLTPSGVEVKAPTLKLEAQATADLKATIIQVEANAMAKLKASAMIQIDGGASLMAKGGVTIIG